MPTLRISHPAFSGANRDATIRFYRDLLEMEIVLQQDNLDFAGEDHFFFHVGEDNFIAYFLPKEGVAPAAPEPARPGSGWMDHLALDVTPASQEAMHRRLAAAGIAVEGPIDRGYERSIYFKDPNGVTVELLAWLTELPADLSQADVIRRAQADRIARGAAFVEDADIRTAVAALTREG